MDKFPSWLPAEVKQHAVRLIEAGGLNTAKPLLVRLVTHLEMESVWKSLSHKTDNPQKLINFLEYVRLHSSLQGNTTNPITIPSDKLQRKAFKKLSELSLQMIKVLGDLSPIGDPQEGWSLLESALTRSEMHEAEQGFDVKFLTIKRIQNNLHDRQQHETMLSFLESITTASQIAAVAPDTALPKRRDTDRAKCNQLVLDLKRYLKHHFSTESPSLIAATVNTAFDLPDAGISADDVRKLKS